MPRANRDNTMEDSGSHGIGQIEKLVNRKNYSSWKFAMQACLEAEDLWSYVRGATEYTADTKKMSKARAKILAVKRQNFGHIQRTLTPKQAWDNLRNARTRV